MSRMRLRFIHLVMISILILLQPTLPADGAGAPPALTARETGVALYGRQLSKKVKRWCPWSRPSA